MQHISIAVSIVLFSAFTMCGQSTERNVPYAAQPSTEQHFDLSWPAGAPKATVLFIHGGSLREAGERRSSRA
jgi:hypothetical protein